MPRALRLLPLLALLAAPTAHAGGTLIGGQPSKLNMGGTIITGQPSKLNMSGTIITGQPSKLHAEGGVPRGAIRGSGPRETPRGRQVLTQPRG